MLRPKKTRKITCNAMTVIEYLINTKGAHARGEWHFLKHIVNSVYLKTSRNIMHKICKFCKHEKPLYDYAKHKTSKDGLRYYCRACATIFMRNYRKTGTTIENEFSAKSLEHLESIFVNLKDAFISYGYTITKREIKK